jgi:hypothetical protein
VPSQAKPRQLPTALTDLRNELDLLGHRLLLLEDGRAATPLQPVLVLLRLFKVDARLWCDAEVAEVVEVVELGQAKEKDRAARVAEPTRV